ncbi:MAG: hypothetical protein IPP51_18430 [Bacteroidetes bacterium]|nr:hypothetical protein [Bacteroidota bacterium]
MFRYLKLALKIIAITITSVLALALLVTLFYGKEIKQLIITELNKNINAEIQVKEVDFSLITHFPFASIDFHELVMKDAIVSDKKDTLLKTNRLSLLFNVMAVFDKDVAIRKIILEDATVHIRIDSAGKSNYHFWKSSGDSSKAGVLDLQKILLKNVDITYVDKKNHQDYDLLAKKAALSGLFASDEYTLGIEGDLFVRKLVSGEVNYINQKPASIATNLKIVSSKDLYTFDKSSVTIADVQFDVAGNVSAPPDAVVMDLDIRAHEADLASFISLLPPKYAEHLKTFKSKGKFVFHSVIKGENSAKKSPSVTTEFSIRDGQLQPNDGSVELTSIQLSGNYTNRSSSGKSSLVVPELSASLSGHKIKADFRLDDLDNAFLTLHASTQLDLAQIKPFLKADTLETLSGNLAMNVSYSGKLDEIRNVSKEKIYKVNASGNIDISHLSFKLKNNPLDFKDLNGNFALNNNDVDVKSFSGNISSTDFVMSGVFKNFIPFLLVHDQGGEFIAGMQSEHLNLDELLSNKSAASAGDTSYIMKFNPRLTCELNVLVRRLHFRKFEATNLNGQIHLQNQVISGRNVSFRTMEGSIVMDATINASRRDSILMNCDAKFANLNIEKLFYEFENFDQTTMMDKNVKGKLSADVQFASSWTTDLSINPNKVMSTCDITIDNGELNNFAPIQALSKYLKVPDLNRIRFSTLKNKIFIANRKITIPNMEINSSAMNLSGSGTHDFDNIVDYHIVLLLSDVLGKKVKASNQSEFGEIQDDGLGRTKLMITMKGPVMDPKFGYDHKAVGKEIKNDIAKEKQTLKSMLKEEFGLFKKDTVKVEPKKKNEEMQIDWNAKDD